MQFSLFGLGNDPVGHGEGHGMFPVLFEGLVDVGAVAVGAFSYLSQDGPERFLVEGVVPGGVGGKGHHLGPAGLEGFLAVSVGALEDDGLLAAEWACAGGGVEEMGGAYCFHTLDAWLLRLVYWSRR